MFELNIVTPSKRLVAGAEMEEVLVPAFRGELNILPGHSPLVSTLSEGALKYRLKGKSAFESIAISWGYVEITPGGVNILAETAELKSEIDLERAENVLKQVDDSLSKSEITPEEIEKLHRKRRRAEARITVVQGD